MFSSPKEDGSFGNSRITEAEGDAIGDGHSRRRGEAVPRRESAEAEGDVSFDSEEALPPLVWYEWLFYTVLDGLEYLVPAHARGPVQRFGWNVLVSCRQVSPSSVHHVPLS